MTTSKEKHLNFLWKLIFLNNFNNKPIQLIKLKNTNKRTLLLLLLLLSIYYII